MNFITELQGVIKKNSTDTNYNGASHKISGPLQARHAIVMKAKNFHVNL